MSGEHSLKSKRDSHLLTNVIMLLFASSVVTLYTYCLIYVSMAHATSDQTSIQLAIFVSTRSFYFIRLQSVRFLLIIILITIRQVFRHGDRNPTETYPNDPYRDYKWQEGWGALTKVIESLCSPEMHGSSIGNKFFRA